MCESWVKVGNAERTRCGRSTGVFQGVEYGEDERYARISGYVRCTPDVCMEMGGVDR